MDNEQRLNKKHAKLCTAVLIAGISIIWYGAFLPESSEGLFQLKIGCIIIGLIVTWGAVIASRFLFKCPYCKKSFIGVQWNKEYFCRTCGKKVKWE